ncbi:FAD-binding oxidoreductase [Desulfogranum marinum]|uniref:FAD-binding oxidoreductase n=1 Tax=Desulfogranum marinum TaxID=453220 RepID=UPI0019636FC3|nr:FAD-linked oxidase C-terminal domain-containing protein [Desulfogranum marinum]MBM9513386.1 FAD-binding protein [Desulfogranum marinum]
MPYPFSPLTSAIKEIITAAVAPGSVITDDQALHKYSGDASKLRYTPEMVICPQSVADVQHVIQLANKYNFAVTPRGAGSGLAGGCLADHAGVVLSTERLTDIQVMDPVNGIIKVQAGVISQDVKSAADAGGLYYPPDPAGMDLSTIGGNAATDAGGPACVKYGTTRDYILGLEAVLPNGEHIATGVQTRKGVVGYDLTNLLVGSEGTLGIITSLWLRLIPKPPAVIGLMCVFSDMSSAMQSVTTIMASGHLPCAIEFLDHKCISLVGEMLPFDLPGATPSILIIELDGPASQIKEELSTIEQILHLHGAAAILPATNNQERQEIWNVRRQVSLRIHDYANVYIPEDVAVPISAIAQLIDALPLYEDKYGVEIFAFGHAGDGNIHLSVTAKESNNRHNAESAVKDLLAHSIELKGTISGEHGIGLAKKSYLPMELSPTSIALQQNIKKLFDPNAILNPGKVFPDLSESSNP